VPEAPPARDALSEGSLADSDQSSPESYQHSAGYEGAAPPADRISVRIIGRAIGALIVLGTIVLSIDVTRLYYLYPRTDDAYIRANIVGMAPHVSGPVALPVHDNQHVKAGMLLLVVDPQPYRSALDKAQADLVLTILQIKALEDAIRSAHARQLQLQADAAYDKQYLQRIEPLLRRHFVTANDVFNARSRLEAAQAGVESARSDVLRAQNDLGQYGDINARRKAAEIAAAQRLRTREGGGIEYLARTRGAPSSHRRTHRTCDCSP